MNKVMVMEPNPFHGEVVPGVTEYLANLGYVVHLFVREELILEGVKEILSPNVIVHSFSLDDITQIFSDERISEFKFLFLTSLEFQVKNDIKSFIKYFDLKVNTEKGILGIYHTADFVSRFDDEEMFLQGRIFFLSDFQMYDGKKNVLNPHTFGKYTVDGKEAIVEHDEVRIAVLGNICNYHIIGRALSRLSRKERRRIRIYHTGTKSSLIGKIKRRLKYIFYSIGSLIISEFKEKKFALQMVELGRLDFETLYGVIKSMDYLLMPIDISTSEGRHYITQSTSGTKQVSFGMNIPIITDSTVGDIYGFNESNAIYYEDGHLEEALKRILRNEIASDYCYYLKQLERNVYNQSLQNLEEAIEKISL